ncbi:hypothetical protein [Bifidobacterium pseudocatenulatum]|uniref:Uncharacterized protein n=1 Tax=Bifidobacterium pseudocatenulatum TaxID=28026 RepID=A0ABY6YCS8_BIFPS|nr:hypothetical protein [Bifidobacterium pseudocatenulatum]MZM90049.1 hypothetical protein [Bifidobacterium pseudocatenulatum]MZN09027.1 hypothetical protein [Bifidobacterium pseudocatenulatum]MZO19857.1 hypothetical protein [Bifidobacterium pseudocatenulatum]RYT52622.1 hypothetical protein EAI78_08175 [Bifidobacterium pseudocatenulatum]CAG9065791.1 hypothetical protein BIFLH656_01502 [Bifidobacterium pseudocatenulatum]
METYEEKLSDIANTAKWSIEEFDDFKRFERVIDDAAAKLKTMKKELAEGYVFGGETQKVALECVREISKGIEEANIPTALSDLFRIVDACNQAIDDARNVELPGTRLTSDIEQAIKSAETPLNIIVPGLGTLTGIIGEAGVNIISNMLANEREKKAEAEFERIELERKENYPRRRVNEAPVVDINGLWPAQDGENNSSEIEDVYPASFGDTGISAAVAGSAGLAAAGGAAVASSKFSNTPKSGSASISRPNVSSTPPLPPRNNPTDAADTGGDNNNSHNGRMFDPNTGEWIDTSKYVYDPASGRWLDRNLYVYDPATGRYVYRNHMAVDSDMSYNGSGSAHGGMSGGSAGSGSGIGRTAVAAGAGIGAGGALAVSKLAGGAGSSSGALSEASMAAVSGSGVGSYYANNPVKASIASSSIKGATGMAAGLRKGEIARAEAAASSRANTPGMMGMGRGGASQSKDKRRNSLGYIAPTIEEEEEFQPKPLAAMAGHRRRPGE